ncbi:MAG: hypothetical protein AAF668_16275 [Pseudomonadota bacterium]
MSGLQDLDAYSNNHRTLGQQGVPYLDLFQWMTSLTAHFARRLAE